MKDQDYGFSLVELIVVVAIMAVMVGVLAPAYLAYVEKTRIQRDESAAGEIFRAAEIVVYSGQYDISDTVLVTFDSSGINLNTALIDNAQIQEILRDHFGTQYQTAKPVSRKYQNMTYTVTVLPPEGDTLMPQLSAGWS